jgi:hypothetical protein
MASGNAFRFGTAGARAKATSYASAIQAQMKDAEEILNNMNFSNAELMHAVLADNTFRDAKGRLVKDADGNALKDKTGKAVSLNTDKAMKAAAIKQIGDGGGVLELAQIHDEIFNRQVLPKGEYRDNTVLGRNRTENQEIWFRGVGSHMGSIVKALPQVNPGKRTAAFDSLTADAVAGLHQKAAIPYVERIFAEAGTDEERAVRQVNALQNLAQVADNANLRTKVDNKVLLAFKMNADKFAGQSVTINGQSVRGDELIYRLVTEQGKMNALNPRDVVGGMDENNVIDESALDRELREWRDANFNSEVLVRNAEHDPTRYEL